MKRGTDYTIAATDRQPGFAIGERDYVSSFDPDLFTVSVFATGVEASRNLHLGDIEDLRGWCNDMLAKHGRSEAA